MSLLADDGATAKLMYDNAMDPNLWTVQLDRDELALALEAERLYGGFDTNPSSVVNVTRIGWVYPRLRSSAPI
jgi:hypothetical protein